MFHKFSIFFCLLALSYKAVISTPASAAVCSKNEELTDCLNPCLPTCQKPFDVTCNFLVCNVGCQCKAGYIRSRAGGECILASECGAYCGLHQEYSACGTDCPDSCNLRNQPCTDQCVQGCYCKKGFILRGLLEECIPESQCVNYSS